ncbi:MAG: hypothetical protein AB7E77_03595 [Desulfobulbus sp.]
MEFDTRENRTEGIGYASMVWVRDNEGREFSCTLDRARRDVRSMDDLNDRERASCMNVNQFIGTERW